jgi:hypothetical protein
MIAALRPIRTGDHVLSGVSLGDDSHGDKRQDDDREDKQPKPPP